MRPNNLIIKGFGSYARETVIPFDDLGDGLYLITGDTGAGKTTIFDAIMFALYGTVGGDHRKINMMHSDYIPKNEDSLVELVFTHNRRQHKVRRTIHLQKKRRSENTYDFKQDAEFWEEGKSPIKGQSAVTKRITELLDNLDAVQFQQIIMLAQGEFRKFLDSNSDSRSAILGRLFDSSPYIRFQNWLQQADKVLSDKRGACRDEIHNVMTHYFGMPENLTEEEKALYLPDHPDLVQALENLIENDRQMGETLAVRKDACDKAHQDLLVRRGVAEKNNRSLDRLSEARNIYDAFCRKDTEIKALKGKIEQVTTAVRTVLPAENDFLKVKAKCLELDRQIAGLRQTELTKKQAYTSAQNEADKNPKRQEEMQLLNVRLEAIRKQLPDYQKADGLSRELAGLNQAFRTGESKAKTLAESLKKADAEIKQIEKTLQELEEAESRKADAEKAYDRAKEAGEQLLGAGKLFGKIRGTQAKIRRLKAEQEKYQNLLEQASASMNTYNSLYQIFINEQARILAGKLKEEADQNGTAMCPVCRSVIQAGQLHLPPSERNIPDQEQVEKARRDADQAETKRKEQEVLISRLKTEITGEQEHAVLEINRIYNRNGTSTKNWDDISDEKWLTAQETGIRKQIQDRKKILDQASNDVEKKKKLNDNLSRTRRNREDTLNQLNIQKDTNAKEQAKIAGRQAAYEEIRKNLEFENENKAEAQIQIITGKMKQINSEINRAEEARNAAKQQLDSVQGQIKNAENASANEKEREALLADQYQKTVTAAFGDVKIYEEIISICGRESGEKWLDEKNRAVTKHAGDKENARINLEKLTEETKGMERTDLRALDMQISEAKKIKDDAQLKLNRQNTLTENHENTLEKVRKQLQELAEITPACDRIHQLSAMAVGAADAGGKLSFERYVMGEAFREILTEANIRLQIMTGGKFELIHQVEASRANAAAGLDIDVMDHSSETVRKAGSLSGGEGFQVSMALALGLSDVVQNHAGGTEIDAMFIDEGFGSLDDVVLGSAVQVLEQLSQGSRQIGIISHVSKLEECISKKIIVKGSEQGSRIQIVF